jgi:hypothetical protein
VKSWQGAAAAGAAGFDRNLPAFIGFYWLLRVSYLFSCRLMLSQPGSSTGAILAPFKVRLDLLLVVRLRSPHLARDGEPMEDAAMLTHISPLDDSYISIQNAAEGIAAERKSLSADAMMDFLKHAIFSRELEPQTEWLVLASIEEYDLLQMQVTAPPRECYVNGLPPRAQPREYEDVRAIDIAHALMQANALPGETEVWAAAARARWMRNDDDRALRTLAQIPLSSFPQKARDLLGGLIIKKRRLAHWMTQQGCAVPQCLIHREESEDDRRRAESSAYYAKLREAPAKSPKSSDRGRPPKPGWSRVREIVRSQYASNPRIKRSKLTYDAYREALKEFDQIELPSPKTIERHLKTIIN